MVQVAPMSKQNVAVHHVIVHFVLEQGAYIAALGAYLVMSQFFDSFGTIK